MSTTHNVLITVAPSAAGMSIGLTPLLAALVGSLPGLVAAILQLRHLKRQARADLSKEFTEKVSDALESWWRASIAVQAGEPLPVAKRDDLVAKALWLPSDIQASCLNLIKVGNNSPDELKSASGELRSKIYSFVLSKAH